MPSPFDPTSDLHGPVRATEFPAPAVRAGQLPEAAMRQGELRSGEGRGVASRLELVAAGARASTAGVRRAAEGVLQALAAPRLSLDALRGAVIRYGRVARELALGPDEMLGALLPQLRRVLAAHLTERPELESWVEWWAIHGYHRAD